MPDLAIGGAPQGSEVRETRVGALDRPAQPHGEPLGRRGGAVLRLLAMTTSWFPRSSSRVRVASESWPRSSLLVSLSVGSPRSAACTRAGSSRIEPIRLAPPMVQPMAMPLAPVRIDHSCPSVARSMGILPVPSPPPGPLCSDPSTESDWLRRTHAAWSDRLDRLEAHLATQTETDD